MKHHHSTKAILAAILITLTCSTGARAQSKTFIVGIRGGLFSPVNYLIDGVKLIRYNADNSPTGTLVSGFGPGGEFYLYGSYYPTGTKGILAELGGRRQAREVELSLAPDGDTDAHYNQLTAASISVSQIFRFPIPTFNPMPYLGFGLGAYLIRWETKYERREADNFIRLWQRGEFVIPGIHFMTGFHLPLYHDLMLGGQFKYSYICGDARIRNEDTSEESSYQELNFGGISLQVGLAYHF